MSFTVKLMSRFPHRYCW